MTLDEAIRRINAWAAPNRWIARVYVFGSRAHGNARAGSDIDVTVELTVGDEGDTLGIWILEGDEWGDNLQRLLPWKVHLELYHPEATPHVVEYVATGGREIYRVSAVRKR